MVRGGVHGKGPEGKIFIVLIYIYSLVKSNVWVSRSDAKGKF